MSTIIKKIADMQVPAEGYPCINIFFGFINIFFWGFGMIILGALYRDIDDVIIGILQLFIPVIGWMWAVVWGIVIIINNWKLAFRGTQA